MAATRRTHADPANDGTTGAEPSSEGPFPVVLFAHGFLGSRTDFAPLKAHLASHGYVVIAPDFPASSAGAAGGPTPADLGNQPGDLGFVAEQVRGLGGVDAALAAALDALRTGVVGYSLGADTAIFAAYHPKLYLPGVKVAVAHAPATCFLTESVYQRSLPALIMGGGADQIVPFHTIVETAGRWAKPPLTLVELVGGTHIGFFGLGSGPSNADATLCDAVHSIVGCNFPTALAALVDDGVPGGAYDSAACGPICGEAYTPTMTGARQLELVKAITLAELDAVLRERGGAARYLSETLLKTTDVSVRRSGTADSLSTEALPVPDDANVACTLVPEDAVP